MTITIVSLLDQVLNINLPTSQTISFSPTYLNLMIMGKF